MISRRDLLKAIPAGLLASRLRAAQKAVLLGGLMGNQMIIDVGMGTDWGQTAQIGIAFSLQALGYWSVLGIICSSLNPQGPMACDATARYCGWNYPNNIGVNHGSTPPGPPAVDFNSNSYVGHFTDLVATRFLPNQIYANYPESTQVYRKLLAGCVNGSVTIVACGAATSLANLLKSPADSYSPLTGLQLVTAKVKQLVVDCGFLPFSSAGDSQGGPEYNIAHDPVAFAYVCTNWPTAVVWAGIEMATFTYNPPASGRGSNPLVSPIQYAYQLQGSTPEDAYDIGLIFAAEGLGSNFAYGGTNGTMTINTGTGDDTWTSTPGNHSYLTKVASDGTLQAIYNSLVP